MFASPDVLNLLVYEFAGSGGGRLAFPQVFLGASNSRFLGHYASFGRCLITDAICGLRDGVAKTSSPGFSGNRRRKGSHPQGGGVLDPWKLRGRKASMLFWDVDTQRDFLVPGGRLYISGAEKIIPNLHQLTRWAGTHQVPVISSACAHRTGDPELGIYGEHCMAETPGQQKVAETLLPNRFTLPTHEVELPNLKSFQQIIIEKQQFDVFTNPNTERVLDQFRARMLILLYGAATETCVAPAANSLLERGHRVELVTDAIAAFDERKAAAALHGFAERGGILVETHDVLRESFAA